MARRLRRTRRLTRNEYGYYQKGYHDARSGNRPAYTGSDIKKKPKKRRSAGFSFF